MIKLFLGVLLFSSLTSSAFAAEEVVRIGWQVPWATQGQLVQILKHTDILKKNGLKAEFIGKTFGPELNELAMAGAVDVVLTADQPAITLFSKNKGWKAVGRLMYNRTATYVPVKSPIQTMEQLKGKKIGLPMGAAAERVLKEALIDAKLDAAKDVQLVNLGILEHGPLIKKNPDKTTWDGFDALSGFDPTPAILEANKLIRVIHTGKVVSMVLMNDALTTQKPQLAQKMMQSIYDAYDYYRTHQEEANKWFLEEAKLSGGNQEACTLAAQLEPNLKATKRADISLTLSADDIAKLKTVSAFLEPQIKTKVDVSRFIDASATKALK